jgi:hypothetical protein
MIHPDLGKEFFRKKLALQKKCQCQALGESFIFVVFSCISRNLPKMVSRFFLFSTILEPVSTKFGSFWRDMHYIIGDERGRSGWFWQVIHRMIPGYIPR